MDPGEDTGWSIWKGADLIEAGTEKLWTFGDLVFHGILSGRLTDDLAIERRLQEEPLDALFAGIEMVVCEDFRLYPWEMKKGTLNWDQVRTARLIGSVTQVCRIAGIPFKLQPAAIKERAEAAGAEALFSRPLTENRHANDSIRHGIYYRALCNGMTPIAIHANEESP